MSKAVYILFFGAFIFFSCKTKKQNTVAIANENQNSTPAETAVGLNLGNKAPEISLKNVKDSLILLSSIQGKLVLIDFWASWCGPCRYENPAVVAAYKKYKDVKFKGGNGFTIYSVSLDDNRNKWKSAIEKDGLEWPYHVSDLKAWTNEAAIRYDVKGIPTNVLINEKGIIVGKNLRGSELEKALAKLEISDK